MQFLFQLNLKKTEICGSNTQKNNFLGIFLELFKSKNNYVEVFEDKIFRQITKSQSL